MTGMFPHEGSLSFSQTEPRLQYLGAKRDLERHLGRDWEFVGDGEEVRQATYTGKFIRQNEKATVYLQADGALDATVKGPNTSHLQHVVDYIVMMNRSPGRASRTMQNWREARTEEERGTPGRYPNPLWSANV